MDSKLTWKISPKVETLVDTIVACRKEMFDAVKQRNPYSRNLKLRFCDIHASPKLCELLSTSPTWRDCKETKEDAELRRSERRPHSQEMVADFELFKVIKDTIIGDEDIRVCVEFDTSGDCWESFFGNVKLVTK
jgi:hypothetical protein